MRNRKFSIEKPEYESNTMCTKEETVQLSVFFSRLAVCYPWALIASSVLQKLIVHPPILNSSSLFLHCARIGATSVTCGCVLMIQR